MIHCYRCLDWTQEDVLNRAMCYDKRHLPNIVGDRKVMSVDGCLKCKGARIQFFLLPDVQACEECQDWLNGGDMRISFNPLTHYSLTWEQVLCEHDVKIDLELKYVYSVARCLGCYFLRIEVKEEMANG